MGWKLFVIGTSKNEYDWLGSTDWRHGMFVKHESYFNEMWKHCRVLPFDSCKLYESNQNNLPSLGMCKIILATNYLIFLQISNNLRLQLGSKARPKVERCDKKTFKGIWRLKVKTLRPQTILVLHLLAYYFLLIFQF